MFFCGNSGSKVACGTKASDGSGRVSHLWFGLESGKVLQKTSNFSIFFYFGSKKISLGQVKKYPHQRQVGLLYTAGQK